MFRIFFVFVLMCILIGCGAGKSTQGSNSNSAGLQKKRADAAFEELETESKKEKAEDLVLDEKPLEIKEKSNPNTTQVVEKKRPKEMSSNSPGTVVEKKRPSSVSNKKRPLSVSKYPSQNGYPVWFYNPNYDGFLGGVGTAKKENSQGSYSRQKRLAKMLAQAELSKQIKVVVDTELNLEQTSIDKGVVNYYRSKLNTFSKHQADQFLKNSMIQDEWMNPKTNELFVWLVLEK